MYLSFVHLRTYLRKRHLRLIYFVSLRNFNVMEILPNKPNSCPKICGQPSKGYNSADDRYNTVVDKRNRRVTSRHNEQYE